MTALHFNAKDLFRSVRLAFSLQRIWIQFVGLLCSYLVYGILTYLAYFLMHDDLAGVWSRYGLLPVMPSYPPIPSLIVYALGVFIALYGYMITATSVSRAIYMNLKGNTFYTWKEAFAFAIRKKFSILGTPLFLSVMIVFFFLGGGLIGLLGRIPVIGAIGLSLFTLIWIAAALFMVFIGIALIVSIFLNPAILATTDDDAFEGVFQSFSIAFTQPWRLLMYQIANILISTFGFVTFTLLFKVTWRLLNGIFAWGMGEKFLNIASAASYYVMSWTYPFVICYQNSISFYGDIIFYSHDFVAVALPVSQMIAAIIMAIFLVILGLYVLSYPLAVFNTGHTLTFLVLKKIKDDENLLERKDREEEDEEEEEVKDEEKESVSTEKEPPSDEKDVKKKRTRKK